MGRTPDHVAGFFCGYAAVPEVFAKAGQKYADNVVAFYEKMRDEHLYVSYAIVPPQIDRSKPAHKQSDPALYAGVVKERDDGIVISGAQQLATGGVLSDWLHLSCIHPLQPGDENYANCRRGADQRAGPEALSAPAVRAARRQRVRLSAVEPLRRVRQLRGVRQRLRAVGARVHLPQHRGLPRPVVEDHGAHARQPPGAGRYVTKLRFLAGLAQRMNEMTGNVAAPPVQVMMGELAAFVTIYESMLLAHEVVAPIKNGVLWPSATTLYSAMAMQSEFNGRMLEMVRELAGGAFITLPSSLADLDSPQTAPDIERYMRSASTDAKSKVALMRLIWDFIGSEFGSRHQQYEKFYGGASFLVKTNVYRNFDWKRAGALVDAALALPPLERGLRLKSGLPTRVAWPAAVWQSRARSKKASNSGLLMKAAGAGRWPAMAQDGCFLTIRLRAFLLYTRQTTHASLGGGSGL